MTKLNVMVSVKTPDALAYARALERRGATVLFGGEPRGNWAPPEHEPYVLTRPCDPRQYLREILDARYDAEGLHPLNLGNMVAGAPYTVPAICEAVDEHLAPLNCLGVVVVGHGLGAVIAAHLVRAHRVAVSLVSRDRWLALAGTSAVTSDTFVINASLAEIPGGDGILQLPLNPPEFSQRLLDIVMARAEAMA